MRQICLHKDHELVKSVLWLWSLRALSTSCLPPAKHYAHATSLPAYQPTNLLYPVTKAHCQPTNLPFPVTKSHYQLAVSSRQSALPTCCIPSSMHTANLAVSTCYAYVTFLLPLRSLQVMEHLDTWALGELFLKEGISCHIVSIFEGSNRIRYAILYYY